MAIKYASDIRLLVSPRVTRVVIIKKITTPVKLRKDEPCKHDLTAKFINRTSGCACQFKFSNSNFGRECSLHRRSRPENSRHQK